MKDKYVRFTSPVPHHQVERFNGTKGHVEITPEMVGVLSEKGTYVFDEIGGIIPEFIQGLLLNLRDSGRVVFMDGTLSESWHDQDDKNLKERFEKRLFTAKNQIDIDVAKMYYEAGQIDRLSIKSTVMKMMSK